MTTPREFVDALWSGVTGGHVWLRRFPSEGNPVDAYFRWPAEADTLVSVLAACGPHESAFVGAGIRSEPTNMRKHVNLVPAFWTTIDLGSVPRERAVEALVKFPARPSAGILHNNVILALWFLKEPMGPSDFEFVWAANKTIYPKMGLGSESHRDPLLSAHGLQANHYDFDGLIRAPGQPGAKIVCWRPEARYTLDEFADLVCPPKKEESTPPAAQTSCVPSVCITAEQSSEIAKVLGQIWLKNTPMGLHVAGILARTGVDVKAAREIIHLAVKAAGGDIEKSLKEVDDTYQRQAEGSEITGFPSLEKLIEDQCPPVALSKAKKALERIQKILPEPSRPEPEPDFHLVKPLIKFDSRPARWEVKVRVSDGRELAVTVETQAFLSFNMFQAACYEQTHAMLADISQCRWKRLISDDCGEPEVRETPAEAKPDGAIETSLEEFLSDAKENPDVGLLKSFPGYDEESRFFRFAAFRDYLKENGVKCEDRVVYDFLKRVGYKNGTKRFGPRIQRLWVQNFGPVNGNGHEKPETEPPKDTPKAPEKEKEPDLFGDDTPVQGDLAEGEGQGGTDA